MRHYFFVLLTIACGCNQSATTTSTPTTDNPVSASSETATPKAVDLNGCYQMTLKQDTATMMLQITDTIVSGELIYDWHEKDGNTGTLKGTLRDSLIYAEYTFQSEGMTSVREVIFNVQDTMLQQAVGDLDQQDNKIIYKDKLKLDFNSMPPFMKVNCAENDNPPPSKR